MECTRAESTALRFAVRRICGAARGRVGAFPQCGPLSPLPANFPQNLPRRGIRHWSLNSNLERPVPPGINHNLSIPPRINHNLSIPQAGDDEVVAVTTVRPKPGGEGVEDAGRGWRMNGVHASTIRGMSIVAGVVFTVGADQRVQQSPTKYAACHLACPEHTRTNAAKLLLSGQEQKSLFLLSGPCLTGYCPRAED